METKLFDIKPLTSSKIEWCKEDQTDYKIIAKGMSVLTDSELLGMVIGEKIPELARVILNSVDNNLHSLGKLSIADLEKLGLTKLKAITLASCLELGRRRKLTESPDVVQIRCSKDVSDILQPILGDLAHEEFWILFLNRSNRVMSKMKSSQGGISGTVTDVRIIMKQAIERLASGIIVCHNHPSGNLNPSESDTRITQKIKEAGALMDIQLLDHIIISDKDYYSFADNGLL